MQKLKDVIGLGRNCREENRINLRIPLQSMQIIDQKAVCLEDFPETLAIIKEELNLKELVLETNEEKFLEIKARPNFPVLGKRLGKRMKHFQKQFNALSFEQISSF